MEKTGTTSRGKILIISCPGYSQTHHRRAMSPSIHVKLNKISQQERLSGALCRLSGVTSYRGAGHNMESRESVRGLQKTLGDV